MNTLEILKAARDLISDEKRWTQQKYARSKDGCGTSAFDEEAVCFCSVGALINVSKKTHGELIDDGTLDHLHRHMGEDEGVPEFNDAHTHAEVLNLFDRAIAAAEGEAA